jgi:hypothetical protein
MRAPSKSRADFLRSPSAIFRKLAEALELIGGVKILAGDVLVKADLGRVVHRVDDTADRLGLLDLLALHAEQLRQPAAFANGYEIAAGRLALAIVLGFNHKVLQHALGGDARRLRLDRRLAVRRFPGVLRMPLELVERNENRLAACRDRRGFRADLNRRNRFRFSDAANVNVRRFRDRRNRDGLRLLRCPSHCSNPFSVNAGGMAPAMPPGGARALGREGGGYRRAWPGCAASEVDRKGRKSEDDAPPCERAALPSRRR